MNSGQFGVRNAKPDGNLKKQGLSETLLNLRCDVHVAGTSHGIFHRKQTSPHVPLIAITCRNNTIRNQRTPHRPSARTFLATETSHPEPPQ